MTVFCFSEGGLSCCRGKSSNWERRSSCEKKRKQNKCGVLSVCEKTVSSTSPSNAFASAAWESKQHNGKLLLNKNIDVLNWNPRDNCHLCSDLLLDGVGIQPNECEKNLALC